MMLANWLEKARQVTFQQFAENFIAARKATWENKKHARQWPASMQKYAFPVLGTVPIADIDSVMILNVLEQRVKTKGSDEQRPFREAMPETAARVLQRMAVIFDAARARKLHKDENPARLVRNLDRLEPKHGKRKRRHHPSLHYRELPRFMQQLREHDGISAAALHFLILTAARTSEVTGARWNEIDLVRKIWTVPAERMKARVEHRVPLTKEAVEVLRTLPRINGTSHVFPGARRDDSGLSNAAMDQLLKGMGYTGDRATVHGFRSSFKTFFGEETRFPSGIVEAALAHRLKDKTEQAYSRGDLIKARRQVMERWSRHCFTKAKRTK